MYPSRVNTYLSNTQYLSINTFMMSKIVILIQTVCCLLSITNPGTFSPNTCVCGFVKLGSESLYVRFVMFIYIVEFIVDFNYSNISCKIEFHCSVTVTKLLFIFL